MYIQLVNNKLKSILMILINTNKVNLNNFKKVKFDVKDILKEYKFEHYTVEVEFNDENCDLDDN